jgi:hypothetical protein
MKINLEKLIMVICLILFCIAVYYYVDLKKDKYINKVQINKTDSLLIEYKKELDKLTNDTVYQQEVINITNNYKNIYEKNNNIIDSLRYELIDSIISRHRKIKLERSYTLLD